MYLELFILIFFLIIVIIIVLMNLLGVVKGEKVAFRNAYMGFHSVQCLLVLFPQSITLLSYTIKQLYIIMFIYISSFKQENGSRCSTNFNHYTLMSNMKIHTL